YELLTAAVAAQRVRGEARRGAGLPATASAWAAAAAASAAWGDPRAAPELAAFAADGHAAERAGQAELLRDLVGNPFRPPPPFPPGHRTPEVVALARAIADGAAFDRLPELADALEQEGFRGADALAHLRGPGPHARGCWVLDAVLDQVQA